MSVADWVKDWGGFEQLVAKLNETGDVKVEHNVTLPGRSDASCQILLALKRVPRPVLGGVCRVPIGDSWTFCPAGPS